MTKTMDLPKIDRPRRKHPGAGHRGRLRDRFLRGGIDALLDYEIVELLLTLGTPMKDCKFIAKEAIKKFGGLRGVLDAPREDLRQVRGIGPLNSFGIKLFQAVSERYARERVSKKAALSSLEVAVDYLQKLIGREKQEHFVILSLDVHNNLIKISNISVGTLDASIVHPREVFEPAISVRAAGIIIAHNHPSGNPTPSDEDHHVTDKLVQSGLLLNIPIIDHIIVSNSGFFSFDKNGLLHEYEKSYQKTDIS